jgi:5-methylcytosine-specific restriction endonuclease McrA
MTYAMMEAARHDVTSIMQRLTFTTALGSVAMADSVYTPCLRCGELIEHLAIRGRRRRFCSDVCRVMAKADLPPPPPRPALVPVERTQVCIGCGVVFQTTSKRAEWCGSLCAALVYGAKQRAVTAVKRARTCEHCGAGFVMGKRGGKACRGLTNEGRFCSRACYADHKRAPGDLMRARGAIITLLSRRRECDWCGGRFQAIQSNQRVCSDVCRVEDDRRRFAARHRAISMAAYVAPSCRCIRCDVEFVPEYGSKRRRFCSDRCLATYSKKGGAQRRRARLRGAHAEDVNPYAVFERDGWRCYLCGEATPTALRGNHDPRAPELDHVVPLASGGAHTYANCACACRECNILKGALTVAEFRSSMDGVGAEKCN